MSYKSDFQKSRTERPQIRPDTDAFEDLNFAGWGEPTPRSWTGVVAEFICRHDRVTVVAVSTLVAVAVVAHSVDHPVALVAVALITAAFGTFAMIWIGPHHGKAEESNHTDELGRGSEGSGEAGDAQRRDGAELLRDPSERPRGLRHSVVGAEGWRISDHPGLR